MKCQVYFLRPVGQDGPVKIGSSIFPWSRLKTFASWSPVALELVAMIPGDQKLERRFHARFMHLHSHGEWFHAARDLTETLTALAAGEFDTNSLPEPKRIGAGPYLSNEVRNSLGASTRLWRMRKAGYPIPHSVYEAAEGRHQCDPATLAAKRAIVASFVAEHYERSRQTPPDQWLTA